MKQSLLLSVAMVFCISVTAQSLAPEQQAPLFEHMLEVNAEWAHMAVTSALQTPTSFTNDNARISMHLELVEAHLRSNTPTGLSTEQLENRSIQLDLLNAYWKEGRFPINLYHSVRQPYFIDHLNTACAVGHLMRESGYEDVAELVHENMNYAYVREIPYQELAEWASEHGFTVDELAWVQPGYPPQTSWSSFGTGTDGEVSAVLADQANNLVYVAGQFTTADGVACSNVGKWNGTTFEPLGAGLAGYTYDMIIFDGELYAAGEYNGSLSDLARWDGSQWQYQMVFEGKAAIIHDLYELDGELYAAGGAAGFAGYSWYVSKLENGDWSWVGGVFDEPVLALGEHDGQLAAGGAFTWNYFMNGSPMAHVAVLQGAAWQQLGDGLDATVHTLQTLGDMLFAGGEMGLDSLASTFGLAYLASGSSSWTGAINPIDYGSFLGEKQVNTLCEIGGELYVGGAFNVGGMLGVYGQNIAHWDSDFNYLSPLAVNDNKVLAVDGLNSSLIMGGLFTSANFTVANHIARTEVSTSITELHKSPFLIRTGVEELQVEYNGNASNVGFRLLDLQGKTIWDGRPLTYGLNRFDVSQLATGAYVLDLREDERSTYSEKVVIQ